jgi:hypothetical protein
MAKIYYTDFKIIDFDIEFNETYSRVSGASIGRTEINAIGRYMTYAINRTKKQIERWENHLQNEGQVTYIERIQNLNKELEIYQEFLKAYKHNNSIKK